MQTINSKIAALRKSTPTPEEARGESAQLASSLLPQARTRLESVAAEIGDKVQRGTGSCPEGLIDEAAEAGSDVAFLERFPNLE